MIGRLLLSLAALIVAAGAAFGGTELVGHTGGGDWATHYICGSIVGICFTAIAGALLLLVGMGVYAWWEWVNDRI